MFDKFHRIPGRLASREKFKETVMPEAEVAGQIIPAPISVLPLLNQGEIFLGVYCGPDGELIRVILLPEEKASSSWKSAMKWAKDLGGDLPIRIEQAMLFAYLRDEFRREWYWSNQLADFGDAYAWYQNFDYGTQEYSYPDSKLRARAVRRSPI